MQTKDNLRPHALWPETYRRNEMITTTSENVNSKDRIGHAAATVGKVADAGLDLGLLKKKLENAVEETMLDAERLLKHGRRGFEDAIEDTTYLIKKNPWQSVAYAAGAALCLGLFTGWLFTRRNNKVQ